MHIEFIEFDELSQASDMEKACLIKDMLDL